MRPARVLIVDDSATMRAMLAATLASDPGIEIVGQAANPHEAREAIKLLNPDVVTLDVEMPGMDGLSFLERIMRLRPTPVVMVSSMTADGASATIEALRLGAVDCVQKPTPEQPDTFTELPAKVRIAAKARLRGQHSSPMRSRASGATYAPGRKIVAIGASTGGVEALMTVLANYPENCPPTVITLHMPALFTRTFAQRLDKNCAAKVSEARHDAPLNVGHVYLAPGGPAHLEVVRGDIPRCRLRASDPVSGHRPSVDVLFHSVASAARDQAVGVILTGMGGDGAEGLVAMRRAGARTIGQDEASCVVYGMPRVAEKLGAVERQLPLGKIGEAILALTASK